MKTKTLTLTGQGKEVEVPKIFSSTVREDLAQKFHEINKEQAPYAPGEYSGMKYSASGIAKHRRHLWKTQYGHGISRIPRKIMWRRGTQFYWVGATINSARGGRAAHPPRVEHFLAEKKMNKKEAEMAIKSAIASTAQEKLIRKRYSSISKETKMPQLPIIVDETVMKTNTKELIKFLKENLKGLEQVIFRNRAVRAGIGKRRGRKYKQNAGLLMITGNEEEKKFSGIEIKKLQDLEIADVFPLGRLTIYTEKAIKELNEIKENK
ncbi:MAG: 50S ribosomal protein L4 [Nanoarchaeota archaeon]